MRPGAPTGRAGTSWSPGIFGQAWHYGGMQRLIPTCLALLLLAASSALAQDELGAKAREDTTEVSEPEVERAEAPESVNAPR